MSARGASGPAAAVNPPISAIAAFPARGLCLYGLKPGSEPSRGSIIMGTAI